MARAAATSPTASPSGMTGALEGKEVMVGFFSFGVLLGFFPYFPFLSSSQLYLIHSFGLGKLDGGLGKPNANWTKRYGTPRRQL